MELYDRAGKFLQGFAAPTACYLAGQNVQWDQADKRIAVLSDSRCLYVIDARTGDTNQVATDLDLDRSARFSWSRDGSVIAIASLQLPNAGLYFVPALGGPSKRVLDGPYATVSMSTVEDVFAAGQLANEGRLFELRRTSDRELLAEVGRASETGWADSLRFDPTGDLVAAAFEGFGLEVWRCATRSRIAELKAPSGAITDVRWSADGSFLMATSHERQVVRVYDRLAEWAMLAELEPRVQSRLGVGVNSGSIGPDGSVFLVPQGERGIDLWQLPPPVSAQLDD